MRTNTTHLLSLLTLAGLSACHEALEAQPDTAEPEVAIGGRMIDPVAGAFGGLGASVAVETLGIERSSRLHRANYRLTTRSGRAFAATVEQRVARDGEETDVNVTEIATGETVSWALDETGGVQTTSDGTSVALEADGDDLYVSMADGSYLMFDYSSVEEGSEAEAELDDLVALSMMDAAPVDDEQLDALTAASIAADEDLGAGTMGLWSKLKRGYQGVKEAFRYVRTAVERYNAFICGDSLREKCEQIGVGGTVGTLACKVGYASGNVCELSAAATDLARACRDVQATCR